MVAFTSGPSPIILANPNGGAIFVVNAKISLKSVKNGVFCMLFRPMGWGYDSFFFNWLLSVASSLSLSLMFANLV